LENQTNVEQLLEVADPRNLGAWHGNYVTAFQAQFSFKNFLNLFLDGDVYYCIELVI
jgi:hypothetical protein